MSDSTAPTIKPARRPAQSPPPKNCLTNDILAHLAPPTAVDALTTTTGALRACLSGASMTDRDFAVRTAVTSKTIWEWVDELQNWSWPAEGGSAGFEMPSTKRNRLSIQATTPDENDKDFMGSLAAKDLVKYEQRLAQIQHDLNNLGIEEIKAHVLNNHILPLSRPGTPLSEFTRSGVLSSSSYNRMEDLTAVITAIVVQALPNLAKLARLLQTWNLRLSVLRRVPALLLAIEDAEVAVKSGWNAISLPSNKTELQEEPSPRGPTLMKKDFDVMKVVLEKKISEPGHSLDYMLDCLEGLPDTLPDEWLDRMEMIETSYAEWVAACESRMRETEWAKSLQLRPRPRSPSPVKKSVDACEPFDSFTQNESLIVEEGFSDTESSFGSDAEVGPIPLKLPRPQPSSGGTGDPRKVSGASEAETVVLDPRREDNFLRDESESPSLVTGDFNEPKQQSTGSFNGAGDVAPPSPGLQPSTPTASRHLDFMSEPPKTPARASTIDAEIMGDTSSLTPGNESPELPPLRPAAAWRHGDFSRNSTITHRASSHFDGLSSDLPEISASPDLPRNRIREAEYLQASPPSSPPLPAVDIRESSIPPFDSPLLTPNMNDDDFLMANPIDDSFTDDFDDSISLSEFSHSFDRRGSAGDQQLQQQISQIISAIPAKIKLSNEFPPINLNPPDLQLPRIRKKSSIEPFRRSASSLSSRAGTPSFTLSPAKNSKPRSRGQQEIKIYHLSRSTGETPIKLFIRCVGEQGERVMVRVGGGWADLGEYLKEYASHHKRRSAAGKNTKVEVQEQPHVIPSGRRSNAGSSPAGRPAGRPASAIELSPMSPLAVRKTRRSVGAMTSESPRLFPKTPVVTAPPAEEGPSSEESNRSRSSSRLSWAEDDSSFLGLAGPTGKKVEMSDENKAWVESVKEKVRLASGEHRVPSSSENRFGELGKVGGTKRVFRRNEDRRESRGGTR